MNLDDFSSFSKLDTLNMLGEIEGLPDQLQSAWNLGQALPHPWKGSQATQNSIRNIVLSGMGGSAIGADLLAAYLHNRMRVPVAVSRDYGLPAWAQGNSTLVITSSHSGDTEETLDAFEAARLARCRLLAITTGGELEHLATKTRMPLWKFKHAGQPRAAVGYSFGLLLAAFSRLGLMDETGEETAASVATAVMEMRKAQESLQAGVDTPHNPAKRQAGQLMGRWVNIYGAGILAPAARRWKTQLNEIAKAGAGFEYLPEADHNALAGMINPEEFLARTITIFLRSNFDHQRNQLRADLTRHSFMVEGLNTDTYEARGETPLAHIWTTVQFGDYLAYYLAMSYGVDPTPVEVISSFKNSMKVASGNS
jgi:glucose/mannose-6-phosphate isomerase